MNRHPRRLLKFVGAVAAVVAVALTVQDARSQGRQTIKIIVPFGAGSSADAVARFMAEQISGTPATTMIVENRPGAGTIVATETVANAAPDGNTLLFVTNPFVINPHLRKVNYDPLTSFEPICHLVSLPSVIVVNAASPYRSLADLVSAAKARPGDLSLAGVGPGTGTHIAFEMFKRAARVDMVFVPYNGTPPAINALLGNHVTAVLAGYADVAEQLKADKLRPLVVTSHSPLPALPDLPTMAEAGFRDVEADFWYGVAAPAKTPNELREKLSDLFTAALQSPDVQSKLVAQGIYPVGSCGTDFATLIRKQYAEYGRVIRDANLKIE